MNAINFRYWLQGMFELTDVFVIDENQLAIIKAHLVLVSDKDHFCHWFEGMIEGQTTNMINAVSVDKIRKKLNDSFVNLSQVVLLQQGMPSFPYNIPQLRDPILTC